MPSDTRVTGPVADPSLAPVDPFARRHDAVRAHLEDLKSGHLSQPLRDIAAPIEALAHQLVEQLPDSPRLTTGLSHLVYAKDTLVRARLASMRGEGYEFPPPPAPVLRTAEPTADERIVANMQRKAAEKGVTL